LGIVLLAISLDRLTQAMGRSRRSSARHWWQAGPVGFALRLLQRAVSAPRNVQTAAPELSTQGFKA
jgi:glycine betaine/proline transport system permease protein